MKKIIVSILVLASLLACTNSTGSPPSQYQVITVREATLAVNPSITIVPIPEKGVTCYIATENGHGLALQCLKD